MADHRKSQQKTNWYDCKTREDLRGLDESLMTRADAKIEGGCGHIVMPITIAFRGQKPHQIASRKEKIEKIVAEAKPPTQPPKVSKTSKRTYPSGGVVEITRRYDGQTAILTMKRTHPDGTAEERTETHEGSTAAQMWVEWEQSERKRQKTDEDLGNALT